LPERFRTIVLEEVGSTNREAFLQAERGEKGPLWIVARRQTAGRGRSGRLWASEPGNLYATLLIDLACSPGVVPQLSLIAGVAVVDAITAAAGRIAGLRLKWPNDVLIGEAKCAGILAESMSGQNSVLAVIGAGINLAWYPADVGRAATSLSEHGVAVSSEAMLEALALSMDEWLHVWQCGAGFSRIRQAWLDRAGPVGERCTVNAGTERIEGTFRGLDPGGALLIEDQDGRERSIAFGDVLLGTSSSVESPTR
jgi:BirA family transcriptional regulator, biotin operon repressor / biotin---[acetyl-CoA-carboxylase] ligase